MPFVVVLLLGSDSFAVSCACGPLLSGRSARLRPDGFIYLMTGNGGFDAVTDWGESFVKLKYAPRAGATNASLRVVDWWTPWSDDARTGLDPDAEADAEPQPTNFRAYVKLAGQAARKGPEWADMDLGSGGPVVIPSFGLVAGAGKDGVLYVLNQHRSATPAR